MNEQGQACHAHREGNCTCLLEEQPFLPRTPGGDSKLDVIEFHANGFTFTV